MDNTDFHPGRRSKRKARRKARRAKRRKRRKEGKGLFRRIGKGIKKVARRVVDASLGMTILLPLQPFRFAMKKALKKKGISTKRMSLRELSIKFYNEVVSKKGRKDSYYEEISEEQFLNDPAFVVPASDYDPLDPDVDHAIGQVIKQVVGAVVGFFKKVIARRRAAKAGGLTEKEYVQQTPIDEVEMAEDATKVEKELELKSKEDKAVKKMDMKKYLVYGVVGAAVIGLVYFMSKKK